MNIIRWDPFRTLFGVTGQGYPSLFDDGEPTWVPAIDVFERNDRLVIRAEIPGLDRKEIEVRVEDGQLVLQGERKREAGLTEENAYRLERNHGSFVRRFRLPESLDLSKIDATYENGILEVTLPRSEEARPRKIEIRAA